MVATYSSYPVSWPLKKFRAILYRYDGPPGSRCKRRLTPCSFLHHGIRLGIFGIIGNKSSQDVFHTRFAAH
jgi:hypothetical protein